MKAARSASVDKLVRLFPVSANTCVYVVNILASLPFSVSFGAKENVLPSLRERCSSTSNYNVHQYSQTLCIIFAG